MFDSFLNKIALGIVSAATAMAALFGIASKSDIPAPVQPIIEQHITNPIQVVEKPIGAAIPVVVSLFETSLQSRITNADTSMTLVNGSDRNGTALSGYLCFTIDEGSTNVEFVCGTAASTAISSLTRGLDPITGTSTVASLKKPHGRGASVKITNYPQLAIVSRILNGNETLPNPIKYDSSISTSTLAGNGNYLASVNYVNGISFSGAPNATTTIQGLVQSGTAAQLAIGTQNGSTGAVLFAPGNLYASTSAATTLIPVTRNNGKLAQGFLDLSENFAFTGALSDTATTTLAATSSAPLILRNIIYSFPAATGTASSTLINDGSGRLIWGQVQVCKNGIVQRDMSLATGNQNIAHGLGVVPKSIHMTANWAQSNTTIITSTGYWNGTTMASGGFVYVTGSAAASLSNTLFLDMSGTGSTGQTATTTADTTNIILGWTKTGSPTGNANLAWEACTY